MVKEKKAVIGRFGLTRPFAAKGVAAAGYLVTWYLVTLLACHLSNPQGVGILFGGEVGGRGEE